MRILDRYILKSALSIFLTCLFTFFLLYIIIDVFSHLEEILKYGVSLNLLTQYYLAYLPIIFVQVAPIACLLGTLYTFSNLNRNNEIIAMRSSGLSIFQITKTVIIFGIIVSVFVFWVNDRYVPQSLFLTQKSKERIESGAEKRLSEAKESRKAIANAGKPKKEAEAIDNLSIYGIKNRLYFINRFSPDTNTMEGIVILEHDQHQNIIKKIVASKGVYKDGLWRFYQAITYDFDENSQIKGEPQYSEEEIMTIPETPAEFLNQRQRPDFMTIAQLDDYLWKLSKSGASSVIRNLKVELYQRFTMPLTSVIIIFLGIPFSLKIKKRATGLSSIGISLILGFLYYTLNAISIALGKVGILSPILAVSLSHLLAFMLSLYLIRSLP